MKKHGRSAAVVFFLFFIPAFFSFTSGVEAVEVGLYSDGEFYSLGDLTTSYESLDEDDPFATMMATFDRYTALGRQFDLNGYDFQWLEIVSQESAPVRTAQSGQPADIPYAAPPEGGFGGEPNDNQPFFWDLVAAWPFQHVEGSYSAMYDRPVRTLIGGITNETYLVLYNPNKPKEIILLENGGFVWDMYVSAITSGSVTTTDPATGEPITESETSYFVLQGGPVFFDSDSANSDENAERLEQALANGGFRGWNVVATCPDCEYLLPEIQEGASDTADTGETENAASDAETTDQTDQTDTTENGGPIGGVSTTLTPPTSYNPFLSGITGGNQSGTTPGFLSSLRGTYSTGDDGSVVPTYNDPFGRLRPPTSSSKSTGTSSILFQYRQ